MRARLDDAPSLHDHDLVHLGQGGEAVRNDEARCRVRLGHLVERRLDNALAPGVERRGGFVEQKNLRVSDDRAGDANPLALTP